jgi:hypothetical protein
MNALRPVNKLIADGLWEGAAATAATTAVAAVCGETELKSAVAPLNAVSHIIWGDEAAVETDASAQFTLTGMLLNSAAVSSWAILQELVFGRSRERKSLGQALVEGAIVSGVAFATDYYVVPRRFTPGFEKQLSNKSLATIYGALAVSLGMASWWRHR